MEIRQLTAISALANQDAAGVDARIGNVGTEAKA